MTDQAAAIRARTYGWVDKHSKASDESLVIFEAEITGKAKPTQARNPLLEWA